MARTLHRKLRLAPLALAAVMLGGGLFPANVALAQTSQDEQSAVMLASSTAQDNPQKDSLVAKMVIGTASGPPAPDAVRKLQQDLSVLPVGVLQSVYDDGYHYVITKGGAPTGDDLQTPGESPLNSNIYKPVDPQSYVSQEGLQNAAKLKAGLFLVSALFTPQIDMAQNMLNDAEAAQKALPPDQTGSAQEVASAKVLKASLIVTALYAKETGAINDIADQASGGKLAAMQGNGVPLVSLGDANKVNTPGDLAKLHEAATSEQKNEYLGLIKALNPEVFGESSLSQVESFPLSSLGDRFIVYPDFYYDTQPATGMVMRINGSDHEDVVAWANRDASKGGGVMEGQEYDHRHAILLRAGQLGVNLHGVNTSVHETGHAIENILSEKHPAFYKTFSTELDAAYQRAKDNKCFITSYASQDEDEFFAESVAAYYSPTERQKLQAIDPQWFGVVASAIQTVQQPVE